MVKLKIIEPIRGFKYFYGEDLVSSKNVMRVSERVLLKNNFEEIITPMVVDYSLIVGDENRPISVSKSDIVFDFTTINGERLALRYENTFPVCKFYVDNFSTNKKLKKFFYISSQFRNEVVTDVNNRLRQFNQAGWELIGGQGSAVAQAINVGCDILKSLNLKYSVKISEVNILDDIFEKLNLSRENRHLLLKIIDDKDISGLKQFIKKNITKDYQCNLLFAIMKSYKNDEDFDNNISKFLILNGNKTTLKRISDIKRVFTQLKRMGCRNVELDLSLVRSNKFYSGVIFQYYVGENDHECGGGGEYNRVIKSLGGVNTLSCGAAFGLERVIHEYKKTIKK